MISTFLSGFAKIILIPFVFIAGLAGYQFSSKSDISLSGTLPIASATYTLSGSGISSSATSITLSSFTLPQSGHEITDAEMSDTFYLTIEPGNRTRQEIVSCTTVTQNAGDTATLSGCLRGLLPITPYTASSTYAFAHSGGTSVIFSNPPQFYNQFLAADNTGTITGQYTFSTSPVVPTVISASTTNAASVQYVNAVALAGSADAAPTVKGVSKLSVTAASSTNPIVVGDNDTRIPASAAVVSYIPTSNQKLALAGYTGTPTSTNPYLTLLSATSTVASSSAIVQYTTTGQITATTTPVATTDATSKAYVDAQSYASRKIGIATRADTTASGVQTIAHGLGRIPNLIKITATVIEDDEINFSVGTYNTATTTNVMFHTINSGNGIAAGGVRNSTTNIVVLGRSKIGTTGSQTATTTMDATNIYLGWTYTATMAGNTISIMWQAE